MDENLHDIDKLFKNAIEGHEELPLDKVWDSIENDLDKSNVIQIKKKYNNLKRVAIALLLLLLGTLVYEIQTKKTGNQTVVKNKADENNNSSNSTTENAVKATDNKNSNTAASSKTNSANSKEISNATNNDINNNTPDTKNSTDKKTTTIVPQNPKVLPGNNAKKATEDIVNENTELLQEGNYLSKKSSKQKTKIAVKDAAAVEEEVTPVINNGKDAITSVSELIKIKNDKAEKIAYNLEKINSIKINENRVSPDAIVTNNFTTKKGTKTSKPFHFNLTPYFSPQFSFNRIEDDHRGGGGPQPPNGTNGREEIKRDEQHQTSFSLGVLLDVPIGKNWSLQSGINYMNKNISIEPKKIFAKLDNDGKVKYRFDCSSGYTYISPKTGTAPVIGDSVNATASTNTLQYLGFPLAVKYNFNFNKFSISPVAGAVANFLVKQKIETELIVGATKEKQTINSIKGLRPTYFNAFTGVVVEYKLNKRVSLSFTPSGNFALSSITKDAAVKSYPNSFGLLTGVKIKF